LPLTEPRAIGLECVRLPNVLVMSHHDSSRRAFLASLGAGVGAVWISARWSDVLAAGAHAASTSTQPTPFQHLTPAQGADLEAFCAQIIPTDDTPGAREARTAYFIDRALGTFATAQRPLIEQGLADLAAEAKRRHPRTASFAALSAKQQVGVMKAIERAKPEFFEAARIGTILGMFANPEYGGNQEKVGWKLIGFEDQFSWQPPFGYYDREPSRG
jgi:gluconate 2-dehydrogenase gamma chain